MHRGSRTPGATRSGLGPRRNGLGPHLRAGGCTRVLLGSLFALSCAACEPAPALRVIDAAALLDTESVAGPYRFQALVAGGQGRRRVELFLAISSDEAGEAFPSEGACQRAFAPAPQRGVEALPEDAARPTGCIRVALGALGGDLYGTDWPGPPFERSTTLRALVRATDEAGARAWWPPGAPAQPARWRLGPPGSLSVAELAPVSGPAEGGARVLVRGAGFSPQAAVWFGERPADSVRLESPQLLEVVAPPGPPGPVDVTVDDGSQRVSLPEAFRYLAPPRITGLDPREGPASATTLVTVEGEHFAPGAQVLVAGEPALAAQWWSPERLSLSIPPGAPGLIELTVSHANGQTSGQARFLRRPPPALEAVAPATGPDLGGSILELRGSQLRAPGAVWLGERQAEILSFDGARRARVWTPAAPPGPVTVRWYNPDGQSAALPEAYTYLGPPRLVAALPGITSRCGGGLVTLEGRGFVAESRVRFNGAQAEVIEVSADGTRMVVRAPPGAAGPVRIRVENPDGRSDQADDLLVFGVQPVIEALEPPEAPIWGGTVVVITGADFSAEPIVRFGGVLAEQARLEPGADGCDGRIVAVAPAGQAGEVAVVVEGALDAGRAQAEGFRYVAPRLTPGDGLVPGFANLRLEGLDLRPGLTVRIGGRAALDLQRRDDRLWRLRTPPGPHGVVDLEVRNADGRGATLAAGFRYRRFEEGTAETGLQPIGDCNDVSVVDLDGDGRLDLVTANGALGTVGRLEQPIGVHRGGPAGRFVSEALGPAGNGMNVSLGDVDGDGDQDLLVANLAGGPSRLFRNEGGRLAEVGGFPARASAYDAGLIDVDGDGDLDVFLLRTGDPEDNAAQGPEQLWLNDGRGRFEQAVGAVPFDPADVHDHAVGFGDLTGNGRPDAVIVVDNLSPQFVGAANRLLINRDGRFEEADSPFNDYPGDWLHAEIADLDGDGDLDVLLPQDYIEGFSRPGTPAIGLYLNDGAGGFSEAPERIVGMPRVPAFEAVAVDLDGDGDLDLAVAVFGFLFADGSIEPFESIILLNDGEGVYHQASGAFERPVLVPSTDFGPGDFDGDGALDLFECAGRGESLVWFQR